MLYYSCMSLDIFLFVPIFLFAIVFAFFIPGNIFVAKLQLTSFQKVTLSISFGIVLWALQGFLFGYMQMRWLSYFYVVVMFYVWSISYFKNVRHYNFLKLKLNRQSYFLGGIALIAIITQLITTFANGIQLSSGIYFCCGVPDSLFQIALTNDLIKNFPPYEPTTYGQLLKNYHFLTNLVNADLIRVFKLPLLPLQYPYMSTLVTSIFVLNVIAFAQIATKRQEYQYWLLFFVFFSGDILFLLIFIQTGMFNFEPIFLTNAAMMWISSPRVYALMLLFAGMSFLFLWIKEKKNICLDLLLCLTFASLIAFKVYIGLFALSGLGLLLLLYLKEKNIHKSITIGLTFLLSAILFLPINSNSGGFIFTGFWRFEDFASNHVFGLHNMELARHIYLEHGNWQHALFNDILYFFVYFVFIFGTLLLAFLQTPKSLSIIAIKKFHIFLSAGFLVSFLLGSFFIQKTGGANSSQFLITITTAISIYTALALTYWFSKIKQKSVAIILACMIILLTIPRVIYSVSVYTDVHLKKHGLLVDNNQIQALEYLKNNTEANAIILQENQKNCLTMTFLTQRQIYNCLDASPEDRGVNLQKKVLIHNSIFQTNTKKVKKALMQLTKNKNVDYLYISTDTYKRRKQLFMSENYTIKYSNLNIVILKVPK